MYLDFLVFFFLNLGWNLTLNHSCNNDTVNSDSAYHMNSIIVWSLNVLEMAIDQVGYCTF